ncbi:MAG: SMC family ATPase [Thiovulaceae bacterium]|nr:SMC family ATPase [Sulfurimonadaceae bacterium]
MILSKLRLENFKKYRSYEIEFAEGLVGIIGKNGSGKSTLFEAILFALYGEAKTRGNKELLKNAATPAQESVSVELTFLFEGAEYKTLREFRGKNLAAHAKLTKNGELVASGAKEVTAAIVRLTKMGKDAFMHTLFASQKELTSLSALKNEDRKKMIRRLLGLEKIDFIESALVEKRRALNNEISAFDQVLMGEEELLHYATEIESKNKQIAALKEQTQSKDIALNNMRIKELELKTELEVFAKTKETKQALQSEIELLKNSAASAHANQTKLAAELEELTKKGEELATLADVKENYATLQDTLKNQERLKEFHLKKEGILKEQTSLREQYAKAKADITALLEVCQPYESLAAHAKSLENTLAQIEPHAKSAQAKERELLNLIAGEERQIELTHAKIQNIQKLGKESPCPTCTRPLLEEYDNVIASLVAAVSDTHQTKIATCQKELEIVLAQKAAYEEQKKHTEKELAETTRNIGIIQSKQKDLTKAQEYFTSIEQKGVQNKQELQALERYVYDAKTHAELQEIFTRTEPQYKRVLSLETELKRLPILQQEHVTTQTKIAQLSATCQTKEAEFAAIAYDAAKHKAKEQELEEHTKQKEAQNAALNALAVQTATLEGEIKTIQARLENNETNKKKIQTKKEDLQDYEKIKTSLAEFKTRLNAKIAPRISALASSMFAQITKGKYQHIEVSNDFDFFIYDEGKKYPIERFSGGEIDLANLVLRIAISKTLTELNGAASVEFLAFDEVFGSQDEARRMQILEAFHTVKEQYRQIFLISHETEIKEMFEKVVEL